MRPTLPFVEIGPDDPLFPGWCDVWSACARSDRPGEPVRPVSDHVALGRELARPGGARDGTPGARFIEELARRGVTGGCAGPDVSGRASYCPEPTPGSGARGLVTRQQMALFLLRAAGVSADGRELPPYAGTFADVPDTVAGRFVEELARRGITSGCAPAADGGKPRYCPSAQVSRGSMAVFVVRAFDLRAAAA